MSFTYYAKNLNQPFFDSPFVKMAGYFSTQPNVFGYPLIPNNQDIPKSPLYAKAVEILELNSVDPLFVGARIRHLDFAARQSELADSITWKSSTSDAWEKLPIYEQYSGINITTTNPAIQVSVTKYVEEISGSKLNWGFTLSGQNTQFTLSDGIKVNTFEIASGATASIPLGTSQCSAFIRNLLGSGQEGTVTIQIAWPYRGDLAYIKTRILSATDVITEITNTRYDLLQYMQRYSMPEDVIAAFLIGLDSI